MILVDYQIRDKIKDRIITMKNYSDECIQPASYDLRIGPLIYTSSAEKPDKPINLSKNGGSFLLSPYESAVLMTYETLKLPSNMIGRFGLKSGFARKGLFASTGPQVDPGFEGKLFISLFNLVPRSQVLRYKETFLTIEFHTLENEPEKLYNGQYQKMEDITPDILEDIVRFEGLNLSQLQSQFSELSKHVKQWSTIAIRFDEFLEEMKSHTKALEKISSQLISPAQSKASTDETIYARDISISEAKKEISKLFSEKPQMYYSDIAEELNLDYCTVVEACQELQKEGLIEEVSHETE